MATTKTGQRIVTETVQRMQRLARELAAYDTPGLNQAAIDLERWADELDKGADARETQERRPGKRKAAKAPAIERKPQRNHKTVR